MADVIQFDHALRFRLSRLADEMMQLQEMLPNVAPASVDGMLQLMRDMSIEMSDLAARLNGVGADLCVGPSEEGGHAGPPLRGIDDDPEAA